MNSNYGKPNNPQRGSSSLNTFDFDLGLGSNRPTSLKDQKHQPSSYSSSSSSTQSKPATTASWQPNKPTWTHQPAPTQTLRPGSLGGPTSMVGDISGKSWNSTAPSGSSLGIGIVGKNPNLFGDLVGPALGKSKNSSNAPLKSAPPVSAPAPPAKSAYSMGNMADALPKTNSSAKSSGNWGSSDGFGNFTSSYTSNGNSNKSTNLGGPSMRNVGASGGVGVGMSSNKDPFVSLVDIQSKQFGSLNAASKTSKTSTGDDAFGGFQNASKSSTNAFQPNTFPAASNNFSGSTPVSDFNMDSFEMPSMGHSSQNQPPVQASSADPLDMFASFSASSVAASGGVGAQAQPFSEVDDWGMDSEFGGGNDGGGTTTELEGLPPPPAGVSASSAKNKGMDNYKQGQYADAIKWLSWAVILLEKAGDDDSQTEVLSSRASCYKEVGEYKKAVADCTKVLKHDGENVSVLVQRALLYESIEKYRLGADDLRTVLKIDPSNRVARSTVHRLNKMAD